MLIDPLAIKFSPKRGYEVLGAGQFDLIEGWKALLVKVGWSLTDSLSASGFIDYPLGVPIIDGGSQSPKLEIGCSTFATVGAATFTLYDPGRQQPPALASCNFVAMSTTGIGTANALAAKIAEATDFTAAAAIISGPHIRITITSKAPGAIGNNTSIQGDGRFGVGSGISTGGGYELQSGSGASIYKCALTWQLTFPGSLQFLFTLNDTPATYLLQAQGEANSGTSIAQYFLVANKYGFALFDGADSENGAPYRSCSLFAMAPYIPLPGDSDLPPGEFFIPAYAVFLVGAHGFRDTTVWFSNVTTCLDSYANSFSNTGGWPRLLAIRSPGQPLTTPTGKALVTGAYVMFGPNASSGVSLIGKLWDCAVVHDAVGESEIMGQRWLPISTQQSTGSSLTTTLVWALPPVTKHKEGTVTTVNGPSGKASIFYVGGDDFSGLVAGDPITINGVPNVVDSVTDNLALIVANPIVPALTSVGYTVP